MAKWDIPIDEEVPTLQARLYPVRHGYQVVGYRAHVICPLCNGETEHTWPPLAPSVMLRYLICECWPLGVYLKASRV
jgi:hypothetical protein